MLKKRKMIVHCKNCRTLFDSTFTSKDFEYLSDDRFEVGTLHLCPVCGNLGTYFRKDYTEGDNEWDC